MVGRSRPPFETHRIATPTQRTRMNSSLVNQRPRANQPRTPSGATTLNRRCFPERVPTALMMNADLADPHFQTASSPKGTALKSSSILFLGLALCNFAGVRPDAHGQALGPLYQAAPHLDASPRHGPRE